MPNNIKAGLSAVALLVAFAYAYWEWVTGRPDLAWVVVGTGIFAVVAMWIFPEATVKKKHNGQDAKA
jgi:hypothetical protein